MSKRKKNRSHVKYGNLIMLAVSVVIGIAMSQWQWWNLFLLNMGSLGYVGAFAGGMLFASTFTVTTGIVVLLTLAKVLSPIEVGLIAGAGAVLGDTLIFKFVRDGLMSEVAGIYNQIDSKHHLVKLAHTKYFLWMLPVLGALIIISPLPDELGVTLMGIAKMKLRNFLPVSFVLNSIGIFGVVLVARAMGL